MNDMPLMSIIEDKEKENQKLAKLAELSSRLIEMEPESIDYQEIIAGFREIAGAQYAAFNLYKEDGKKFVTVAMAIPNQTIKKIIEILGFNPVDKVWNHDQRRAMLIKEQTITPFANLAELAGSVIPKVICELIEEIGGTGQPFIAKIMVRNKMLGDFTFFMPKGVEFTAHKEIDILAKNLGITLARLRTESKLLASEEKYRQLFEETPISLWEEDFSLVKKALDEIKDAIAGDIREYFLERPDLVKKLASLVRVIDINQATLKLYKAQSKKDFLNGITKVFSQTSYQDFIGALEVILKGEKQLFVEKKHVTLEGEALDIALYWSVAKGHEDTYSRVLVSIVDVTTAKATERQLREQNELLKSIMENAPIAIWLTNLNCKPILVNKFFKEQTGFGTPFCSITQEEMEQCIKTDFHALTKDYPQRYEEEITFLDGEKHIFQTVKTKLYNNDGTILGVLGLGQDITESKENEKKLWYLSFHDTLTGLYNRAYWDEEMDRLNKGREYPLTIMIVDLDFLKATNDKFGHSQGDVLLINCAQILKKSLREGDILARIGGDEFGILLPRTTEVEGQTIKERILENIEAHNTKDKNLNISVSIGVATANDKDDTLRKIFRMADDRMYNEKTAKKREIV